MAILGLTAAGGMLAGPASKENGGSSHCSNHGLLAYGAGGSIVVVDVRSMQLVSVLPMPPPGSTLFLPAPFVTALQWTPEGMQRDLTQELSTVHMRLAVGDRQGRIAIWDVGSGEVTMWLALDIDKGKLGIQDVCWVYGHPWLLMAIHGPSLVVLWNTNSGRCIWRYDATPELLGCVRCDPFDARQICIVGLKGLVLSIYVGGPSETDIIVKRHQISLFDDRGNIAHAGSGRGVGAGGEREQGGKDGGSQAGTSQSGSSSAQAPALAQSPGNKARCMFSSSTRGILYIMFSREMFVFDLQFGMPLSSSGLPRGCAKLLDLLTVVDGDILYCAHVDGKISAWQRKKNKQLFSLCTMDTLMPSLGTSVPAPTVLSVMQSPSQIMVEKVGSDRDKETSLSLLQLKLSTQAVYAPDLSVNPANTIDKNSSSLEVHAKEKTVLETTFLSISDDGRLWHWAISAEILQAERANGRVFQSSTDHTVETRDSWEYSNEVGPIAEQVETKENGETGLNQFQSEKLDSAAVTPTFKLKLTGQLSLLSSSITTLAVPVPSMLATTPGGGNGMAVSVPLVALATQGGTIELIDAAANAITASFLVHSSSVRGVRWLGNSRLVSFSYTEVKGKGGGFVNNLAVTCVRSGQSRVFRTLQKPERAPMRALRTSPSGRYLLILFREAPAEVWAMTKNPQMLRSLALPFTAMEWALPPAPKPTANSRQSSNWRTSLFYKERPTIASTVASANATSFAAPSSAVSGSGLASDVSQDETAESFAFALVNGSLGVFELRGRRVRDFRPKWPSASFVSADVLVTAMAYRMPHVVMGDRSGNIRWWDVTTGLSSTFNSHRGGVRRIKFAPVALGDQSRGRVAVLFNDHTFAIYDLDTQDPLSNALVQPQLAGILVLELDWFPLRSDKNESLFLCVAGADSSFRLLEVNSTSAGKSLLSVRKKTVAWERFRPVPLCSPALLPLPHALALRMLLQKGVKSSWFGDHLIRAPGTPLGTQSGDLRLYLLETSLPVLGETVVAELLLKALEPYRQAGCLLDVDRAYAYTSLLNESCTARFAFAAAHFGDFAEAVFWLQLPRALLLLSHGSAGPVAFWESPKIGLSVPEQGSNNSSIVSQSVVAHELQFMTLKGKSERGSQCIPSVLSNFPKDPLKLPCQGVDIIPSEQAAVNAAARERISWHEKLGGHDATQKRVHELVAFGDFEAAVTLLLSTPPNDAHFYVDALRAISLASAVSTALHELAVKVVAANLVATEDSLSGTHLLCAVGRYQEACSQLQDAGRWVDAATLAAAQLQGSDHARVLHRWADHVLQNEHNLWRSMILYVAAGALSEALAALRNAQQPDSAIMFLLACHESKQLALSHRRELSEQESFSAENSDQAGANLLDLPGDLQNQREDVQAVCEYYGQHQRILAHLCTSVTPVL